MSHGIPKPRGKSRKSKNYNQMLGYQNKPSAPKAVPVTTPSQASINATLLREQQAQLALQQQQLAQAQAELEAQQQQLQYVAQQHLQQQQQQQFMQNGGVVDSMNNVHIVDDGMQMQQQFVQQQQEQPYQQHHYDQQQYHQHYEQQQQQQYEQQQQAMQHQQHTTTNGGDDGGSVWGKPRTWTPVQMNLPNSSAANSQPKPDGYGIGYEQRQEQYAGAMAMTNRSRVDDKNQFGDPDAVDDSFLTASEKQGLMHKDLSNAENRKVVEEQLFGENRHVSAGIDFDKYDDIPVECSGKDIPEPINRFPEANLCPNLLNNINRVNYTRPTPIQKHAIPIGMNGRDIMACAQTGSGKTAAFLFPIINDLMENPSSQKPQGKPRSSDYRDNRYGRGRCAPRGLVLAPTRELASQIFEEANRFTYDCEVRCVVLYGGADIRSQMSQLTRDTDIVVATPGRLMDLVERGRIFFRSIKFLVLDEADRMLDMGFEPQIRRIVDDFDMPFEGRQTSMFSATFPQDIQQLASDFMGDYIFVTVGRVGGTTSSISQNLVWVEEQQKKAKLIDILQQVPGLTLVFVETKRSADMLHADLYREERIACSSIHGDRSQRDRERALWEFQTGKVTVLIATDVAARGLDIPDVAHVINYDLPNEIDSYVHRIGRTGRAGNKGFATSFVNEKNAKLAKELISILEDAAQDVPSWIHGLAAQASTSRGGKGRRGGRGGKKLGFGGRDFRSNGNGNDNDNKAHRGGGRGRGGRRGRGRGKKGGGSHSKPAPSTDSW